MESYEEFILDDDIVKFELDMEQGNYICWVEKYPKNVYGIFAAFLWFYGEQATENDILFYVTHGIDLNKQASCYKSDIYILQYSLDFCM
jgi:hypothetical protein